MCCWLALHASQKREQRFLQNQCQMKGAWHLDSLCWNLPAPSSSDCMRWGCILTWPHLSSPPPSPRPHVIVSLSPHSSSACAFATLLAFRLLSAGSTAKDSPAACGELWEAIMRIAWGAVKLVRCPHAPQLMGCQLVDYTPRSSQAQPIDRRRNRSPTVSTRSLARPRSHRRRGPPRCGRPFERGLVQPLSAPQPDSSSPSRFNYQSSAALLRKLRGRATSAPPQERRTRKRRRRRRRWQKYVLEKEKIESCMIEWKL